MIGKARRSSPFLIDLGETMGGHGSGRHPRYYQRDCVTDRYSVGPDILNRALSAEVVTDGWAAFPVPGYESGWIAPDRLWLVLWKNRPRHGIQLVWTKWGQHGGRRAWYLCRGCQRKTLNLFRGKHGFRCRKCEGLTYMSAQAGKGSWTRVLCRASRAKKRLSEYLRLPHYRTTWRGKKKESELQKKVEDTTWTLNAVTLGYCQMQMGRLGGSEFLTCPSDLSW